uniref:Uncharacterized protein n=1 Tax=Zea mays TaxID=4577 RepID=B4FIG4_MAIZE|nr:unknown [Zea mays]|eukprot:NP_001132880.1 uncharacterized protein LOC100194373 [Zea mays]
MGSSSWTAMPRAPSSPRAASRASPPPTSSAAATGRTSPGGSCTTGWRRRASSPCHLSSSRSLGSRAAAWSSAPPSTTASATASAPRSSSTPEARAAAGLLRQRLRARVRQVHGGPADVPVLRLGRALRGAAGAGRQGVRGRRLRALHGRPPGGAARRPPGPGGQPGDLGVDAPGPRGPGLRRRQGRAHGPAHQRDLLRLPARGRRPARRHCARLRPAGRRRQVPALLPRVPQGRRSGREAHLSYYGYDV